MYMIHVHPNDVSLRKSNRDCSTDHYSLMSCLACLDFGRDDLNLQGTPVPSFVE